MKTLIFYLLTISACLGQGLTLRNPAYVASFKAPAAGGGGGPDAWYDGVAPGSTTLDSFSNNSIMLWTKVTVVSGGTATKLRIYVGSLFGASGNCKAALYAFDGTLMDSGTVNITAGDQYFEITLDDGDTVTATDYFVAWQPDAVLECRWRYLDGFTDGDSEYASISYASFPPASLPSGVELDWHIAAGVYVD